MTWQIDAMCGFCAVRPRIPTSLTHSYLKDFKTSPLVVLVVIVGIVPWRMHMQPLGFNLSTRDRHVEIGI